MIIEMRHPGLPDAKPVKTTDQAFDKVWKQKGWRRVDETPVPFTYGTRRGRGTKEA